MDKADHKPFLKCLLPQCKDLRFSLFHSFPRNPQRCKAWQDAINNPTINAIPHSVLVNKKLCCRHFRLSDYVHSASRKLNIVAVPSLNLKALNELDKCRHEKVKPSIYMEHCVDKEDSILKDNTMRLMEDNISTNKMKVNDENNVNFNNTVASKVVDIRRDELNDNIVTSSGDMDESMKSFCVEEDENGFQLMVNDGCIQMKDPQQKTEVQMDILWLRHKCQCNQCFDNEKELILINFFELETDLEPVMATVVEETNRLEIIWNDGHTSTYNLTEIYESLQQKSPKLLLTNYVLWTQQHTQYRDDLQPLNWYDLMQNPAGTYKALDRLQKSGVLIIQQIPKNDKDSLLKKSIITKLFNQSWDHFTKEIRKDFKNLKKKTPFSNCTFESMDKGLQIITISQEKNNLKIHLNLVDGFQAIEQLPKDSRDFLTQFSKEYKFKDDKGFQYRRKMPVIFNNSKGERLWFNPFHLDLTEEKDFRNVVKHFKILNDILCKKHNQWQVELNEDKIILLDNYRICWNLNEVIEGCELDCFYMGRKHYLSSLSILETTYIKA